jgi:hypothetical protein
VLLQEYLEENHHYEPQAAEILEWWKVSSWLADKLLDQGECIIEFGGGFPSIWGRCTSGQAILLDWVISKIAMEAEILEGQRYEWNIE